MKKQVFVEQVLPEKSSSRVSINAFMMGNLFFILTLIWSLSPEKFSKFIVWQLVLGIPLFLISSLSYSKIAYWEKHKAMDLFGWITNTTANILVMNVVGLMAATISKNLAIAFFSLTIILFATYYSIAIVYKPFTLRRRIMKFLFFLLIILVGGLLPVFA